MYRPNSERKSILFFCFFVYIIIGSLSLLNSFHVEAVSTILTGSLKKEKRKETRMTVSIQDPSI